MPHLPFDSPCMARLNLLGWPAGFAVTAYGCHLGVRTNAPALLPALRAALPPGARRARTPTVERLYSLRVGRGADGAPRYLLHVGNVRLAQGRDLAAVLAALERHARLHVVDAARGRVFVHAGVVAAGGRAIVIAGPSHAGKSTLVAELVLAGATYYSDEYAVIGADGRVAPYARPLGLRDPAGSVQRPWPVAALGGRAGRAALPAGLIVLTEYVPGATWAPTAVSAGTGIVRLLAHACPVRAQPALVLGALRRCVAGVPILAGPRGAALPTAAAILAAAGGCRPTTHKRLRPRRTRISECGGACGGRFGLRVAGMGARVARRLKSRATATKPAYAGWAEDIWDAGARGAAGGWALPGS